MRIKSYFAATVPTAVAKARQELGPDAMLVSAQKARPEARHLGEYEVVFGLASFGESAGSIRVQAQKYQDERAPSVETDTPNTQAAVTALFSAPAAAEMPSVVGELHDLRRQMEDIRQAILRPLPSAPPQPLPAMPEVLRESDLDPELAKQVSQSVEQQWEEHCQGPEQSFAQSLRKALDSIGIQEAERLNSLLRHHTRALPPIDPEWLDSALLRELSQRCPIAESFCQGLSSTSAIALVGPPGVGKTTTLVKLAMTYGVLARRPVVFLSLDQYRIGATEQLRCYAGLLGVGFEAVPTVHGLSRAISNAPVNALVLIDTPGYGAADLDDSAELGQFFALHPGIDVHLVLAASMKRRDLRRTADRFTLLHPKKLLFTKLDETEGYGPLLSETICSGWPLSFLCTGQRIPEDMETATAERIVNGILSSPAGRAIASAA